MVVKLYRTLVLKSGSTYNNTKQEVEVVAQMNYDQVEPGEHVQRPMPLTLPPTLKPTTVGNHVNCTYRYSVECQVSWGSDINVNMPVILYAPQPANAMLKPLF